MTSRQSGATTVYSSSSNSASGHHHQFNSRLDPHGNRIMILVRTTDVTSCEPRASWGYEFLWKNVFVFAEQNVNEALGLSGTQTSQNQWAPIPNSEYDKQIWADPLNDVPYPPPPHARKCKSYSSRFYLRFSAYGALNGIGGPPTDWSVGTQPSHPVWSNSGMGKETDDFWKQQQPPQQQQHYPPMPLLQGAWAPRGMNHGPPGQGQRGGPMMQQQDYQGGWGGPNNMGGNKPMNRPWGDNNRGMSGMSSRNGRPNQNQGRYPGNMGVDVSVPPPMDMHMGGMGGMRNMGPPNGGHQPWKSNNGGGNNGGHRNYNNRSVMSHAGSQSSAAGSMWNSQGGGNGGNMQYMSEQSYTNSSFTIGGASDDLTLSVWHDPNGELKKWQRDTGVSFWGDPEKQSKITN